MKLLLKMEWRNWWTFIFKRKVYDDKMNMRIISQEVILCYGNLFIETLE